MDHLLARGSAVIFPRYQEGSSDDPQVTTIFDLEEGLRTGFEALDEPGLPVVAAGFSWGGALAFYYAARAGRWRVPRPRAVYSVFPADPRGADPLLDLPRPRRTRVVILVGDRDDVVGTYGADTFWTWLRPLPAKWKTYRVVRTTDALFASHEAPTVVTSPVVRKVFWAPLDALVAQARISP
jgi:pimeloyl-ACP methyl ester carboxylesterase